MIACITGLGSDEIGAVMCIRTYGCIFLHINRSYAYKMGYEIE